MLEPTDARPTRHLCMAKGDGNDFKYSVLWCIAFIIFTGISAVLGWAVNGEEVGFWAPLLSHGIQWACCILHAFPFQTERYYDLTGSITYIVLTLGTLGYTIGMTHVAPHPRQIIASSLVVVWALRLGSFLFTLSVALQLPFRKSASLEAVVALDSLFPCSSSKAPSSPMSLCST